MLPFQWNALRAGDRVVVHDDSTSGLDTHEGEVAIVQTRQGGANDVSIRIESTGRIVSPRRHAVHQLPLDRRFSCWRCDTAAGQMSGDPGSVAA